MRTLTSLWYLPCFFIARILTQAFVSLAAKLNVACGAAAIVSFLVGMLLPHLDFGYPWCLDVAFVGAGFVFLGMALRRPLLLFAIQKASVPSIVFAASLALFIAGTVVRGDALDLVLMCNAQYGNRLWFFVNSASGSMVVLVLSMLLARLAHEGAHPFSLSVVSFIGAHTLGIFLLHKSLLQQVVLPAVSSVLPFSAFLAALIASIIVLPLSMALNAVIERFIPELLGQFPSWPASLRDARDKA